MKILQGFRTIIFNVTATLGAWLGATYGIELPEEHQAALATTIMAVINILLRIFAESPPFRKDKGKKDREQNLKP